MLLKIAQAGDDTLRKPSKKLSLAQLKQPKTQELIDLMIETLRDKPGVGLAAPQVGEALQIIIIEDKKSYQRDIPKALLQRQKRKPVPLRVIINPIVTIVDADEECFFEGCLSVGGYRAVVPRAKTVTISGLDRSGKPAQMNAEGWLARIAQHEVDHLSGNLYIDKMYTKSFMSEEYFSKKWAKAEPMELDKYVLGIRKVA